MKVEKGSYVFLPLQSNLIIVQTTIFNFYASIRIYRLSIIERRKAGKTIESEMHSSVDENKRVSCLATLPETFDT